MQNVAPTLVANKSVPLRAQGRVECPAGGVRAQGTWQPILSDEFTGPPTPV
jgi:hypothetical protein